MKRKIALITVLSTLLSIMGLTLGGVASAASTNLTANVSLSGTLLGGTNVTSATHIGPGQYEVTFNQNVTGCAYVATPNNAYSQAILVFTAGGHLSVNGVYVETKNQGGGLTDGPFSLSVNCGGTGLKFAVVGYTANLVRATAGTTLGHPGMGKYRVTFSASVKACAYLATVGDPSNAIALAPNNVSTGSGANAKQVYVETKNPGGGLSNGIPFHLSVVCTTTPNSSVVVVNAAGLPVRGSALTSSFNASTGEYVVATNRAVTPACARIVTRGSVNTAVPFDPATVELVASPGSNTIGVEVRALLFFGGALANEAFHEAILC